MSTIVVAQKNGYVAIGADTQSTFSGCKQKAVYIENHSKLIQAGSSFIAACGPGEAHNILDSYFRRRHEVPAMESVSQVFEMAREMHQQLKDEYFINPDESNDQSTESSRFNYLVANLYGIYGVHRVRSVEKYTRFHAFGSGREFAMGAMFHEYDSAETPMEIVNAGLIAAAEFDNGTSAPFDTVMIKLSEAHSE